MIMGAGIGQVRTSCAVWFNYDIFAFIFMTDARDDLVFTKKCFAR